MDDEHIVTGYRGLFLVTDKPDENFTSFEEGVAEALAKNALKTYRWGTGYHDLGLFTYQLLTQRNGFMDAAAFCQTSNVPQFVQLISRARPTHEQILHLAGIFQQARDGQLNYNLYLNDPSKLKV
jgi:hypothetical protein